jgi:prepilin-type N-terminal cleavage/methylation domain-containing protein
MIYTKQKAFTLIELLIVVSVIGILTTVLIGVISPRRAQGSARDGVRMANIEKLAQSLETYQAAEGKYPPLTEMGSTNTPTTAQITGVLDDYIKNWPEASAAGYEYGYYLNGTGDAFVLKVKSERGTDSCIKYSSTVNKVVQCKVCGPAANAACTTPY